MKLVPVTHDSKSFRLKVILEQTSKFTPVKDRANRFLQQQRRSKFSSTNVSNLVVELFSLKDERRVEPCVYLGLGTGDRRVCTIMVPFVGVVHGTTEVVAPHVYPSMFIAHDEQIKRVDFTIDGKSTGSDYSVIHRPIPFSVSSYELIETEACQFWGSILKLQNPTSLFLTSINFIRHFNLACMNYWTIALWWLQSAQRFHGAICELMNDDVFLNDFDPAPLYVFTDVTYLTMHLLNIVLRVVGPEHLTTKGPSDDYFFCHFPTYFFGLMFFQSDTVIRELERIDAENAPLVIEYVLRYIGIRMIERANASVGMGDAPVEETGFHYPLEPEITWLTRSSLSVISPTITSLLNEYGQIIETINLEETLRDLSTLSSQRSFGATG